MRSSLFSYSFSLWIEIYLIYTFFPCYFVICEEVDPFLTEYRDLFLPFHSLPTKSYQYQCSLFMCQKGQFVDFYNTDVSDVWARRRGLVIM